MKPLLILLTLLCAACTETTTSPLIVTKVSLTSGEQKYYVRINDVYYVYTDSLYQVGDTIQ